jgi:hypothetical protein
MSKTKGLAGSALAGSERAFSTSGFEDGEEVVPFTDVSGDFQRVRSAIARVTRTPTGRLKIFGLAWTDGTGLASVEVRVDSGSWQRAKLEGRGNPCTWIFTLEIDPLSAGEHSIVSRATDARGRTQPERLETKKTYWEDNAQFRRTIAVT